MYHCLPEPSDATMTVLCRESRLENTNLSSNFFIRGFSFLSKLESLRESTEIDLRILETDFIIEICP